MKTKTILACTVIALSALCGGVLCANAKPSALEKINRPFLEYDKDDIDSPLLKDEPEQEEFIDFPIIRPPITPIYPGFNPSDLPEEYCMRDEYILYAQDQDKQGYCWDFAATMSAATTIMKATNEYYDFSELWTGVDCFVNNRFYSKIGGGGTLSYQYQAMQRSGLMLECDLPYEQTYVMSNENTQQYYDFYHQYANDDLASCLVSDSSTTYSRSKVDEIKRHIYEHGSITMCFSFRTGFLEENGNGIYALPPHQKNTNSSHAISVIGWDDNFEREITPDGTDTPTVYKGAWIVLNSYTESNSNEGLAFIFYEDTNIYDMRGYRYETNTNQGLYFYDKIEKGYAYPTNLVGKYYGDFTPEEGETKQLNIFYDDVDLEYSYSISEGAEIQSIDVYLDNVNVTNQFDVRINSVENRFYISKKYADYGQYKVVITYGNNVKSDTYLNNFFVTHGLLGEKIEFKYENNHFGFNTGYNLEFLSSSHAEKDYAIYTNQLSGSLEFVQRKQSIYSEKDMSIPTLSYQITDGKSCVVTHTITANDGYELKYNFHFIYCEDTSLQPVNVHYDLNGGVNHNENYEKELAGETTKLTLFEPTRPGYTFMGWYIDDGEDGKKIEEIDGVHYVNWEDIHHMGDNPTLFALSHYKNYYNNSNVLFISARWEEMVAVEYSVDENVLDHYLSTDSNAISGDQFSGLYDNGQTVYLFIKRPLDNDAYTYSLPDGFETVHGQWARKAIVVDADAPCNETVQLLKTTRRYTVTWKNWDGSVIYEETYFYGESPVYYHEKDGENVTPTKTEDAQYTYEFVGWSPMVETVSGTTSYTALFAKTPKTEVIATSTFLATVIPLSAIVIIGSSLTIVLFIKKRKKNTNAPITPTDDKE
ncbi:MAG: hypothetical protein E7357_03620 [Clostridiales bacterium]|nr:hypothetical protein [Clostridiales bacterium]